MMKMEWQNTTKEEVLVKELIEIKEADVGNSFELVVYNDEVNTFDWVIECFMDVLQHSFEQSEQLSLLIHFKGKAAVKTAAFKTLKPLKDALTERGLSAVIEALAK